VQATEANRGTGIDLKAFHAGGEAVIREIYVEHGAALLRETCRYAGPAEAESVVHDVFVELLRNPALRAQFVGGALAAWLRQIARLKAFEHLRRVRRRPPPEPGPQAHHGEGTLEARNVLTRFLAVEVPEAQKQFFGMRFLAGQTQVEIAAELGIPRSTLEGWEHRLTEKLRAFVVEMSP
jgi:RNA polymerase sigma factor (sigma-70 family)